MLKLKEWQYLNFIFQLNYTWYDETLLYKIVYYKHIYKFESENFFIRCIFFNLD